MGNDCELLFFDTFSHDTSEELNLDLVQFPRPVYIFEIRIIPLGARVQADFPGGHRLGATNPSSFQLEFFINDLSKCNACTFEKLGSMEYKQNVDIQFPVPNKIPTDGLVLRGWYNAVTLAVYGVLAKTTKERPSPPPPPPPQANARTQSQDHSIETTVNESPMPMEWDHQPRMGDAPPPEPPLPPVRPHPAVVDAPHFVDVPQIMHPQPPSDQHVAYPSEMAPAVFSEPPPPQIVYQECIPVGVPQVPTVPPPYGQYEGHYTKPWQPEEQYQSQGDTYAPYNRPEGALYPPQPDGWDPKDHRRTPDENYMRPALLEHPPLKDRNRDHQWDRDVHDYDDDHDPKRKDRPHPKTREASWDRSSIDSDRYRDRDRMRDRESTSRDRDRDRDRPRSFPDRNPRKEVKRPTTPPSPRKPRPHTPQTPPDDKMGTGPRTPKEDEPSESYDDRPEGEIQEGDNTEDDGYEEIVSEEEDMSDVEERTIDMSEIEYDLGDETWNYMSSFSPYACELTTFQYFSDPTLFPFEIEEAAQKKNSKNKKIVAEKIAEANKTLESFKVVNEGDHTEKWVETLESINENALIGLLSLNQDEKYNEVIGLLVDWVIEGLDFERSLRQPQTAYKVRHLKAGIRLATLMFQTNADIVQKLLKQDVPKLLLQLFDQPYMALIVKLFILRAIDMATTSHAGLHYIINKQLAFAEPHNFDICKEEKVDVKDEAIIKSSQTCYQKLLGIFMSKQLTRAVVSLSALLNKIHMYEVLLELSECVEKLVHSTQISDAKSVPCESPEPEMHATVDSELDMSESVVLNSGETLSQIIISCLQEITSTYHNAWKCVAQTKRFLPAPNQFEFPKSPYDPFPGLLRMFKENKLLQNIFVLLSSPALAGHPALLNVVKELFLKLLSSQKGMLFLLSIPEVTNGIQKTLQQTVDETREDTSEENMAQSLGMQIAFYLQSLLYVDCLMLYHARDGVKKEPDESETVSALHHIYTMVFSPIGRPAVVNVLTTDNNLNCLLPFVQMCGEEDSDAKMSRSVCTGYVIELLMLVVQYSEDVSVLEKFSEVLFTLSQQENTPKLHDLGAWMAPARSVQSYTHEAVNSLMTTLKAHVEDANALPPELVTTLRILQHIALPHVSASSKSEELKYMYAIIQVFSNDGMDSFKGILQNVCDTFLKPSHQSSALVGLQGMMVVSIIKPAVCMLKSILSYLISSRGAEFRDLTAVPILLKVYSLMLLVPPSSFAYQLSQLVLSEVIESLLTYTQPFLGSTESEEALSKSLWTEMVQEIFKYVKLLPSNFITGLTVLSELLPLPLPLQTREPLSEEEVLKMVNYRKLWSAHLHSLSGIIQEVIVSLAATSFHPLQQLLRRVCVQLADLAAPTALVIVRAVLDALLDALTTPLPSDQKENFDPVSSSSTVPEATTPVLKTPTSFTARILNLVAYLVSHSSFKIPMMHVLRGSVKADEKYVDVLPLLLELFNSPSDKPYVIQSQECIVSIFQSLCDPDIGFITFENGASINEVLASCLPAKEHMSQICGALIQHIGSHDHNYSSVLPSLRSLVMLTEHDYGYFHVKLGLDQHPGALYSLFKRFSSSFSKDSSDCLSTLSTTLEFLRLMVNGFEDSAQTGRSLLLSSHELAEMLRHSPAESGTKNSKEGSKSSEVFLPVVELEKLLTECGNDEEAVESLLESISGLLLVLRNSAKENKPEKETTEPVLPIPESQSAQFSSRPVFMVGDVEDGRLSPAYWLSIPVADDADQEQEQVPVDLISMADKNIPGEFDLKATLEKQCLSTECDDLKAKKKTLGSTPGKRKYQPLVNPGLSDLNNKRPFTAPMRGRGFSRGGSHTSRANDPFRSRPPNTSRPPSMHVDDFVALESHHSSNNSQVQSKRPAKDGTRGRGRGFERSQAFPSTRGTGGRFFSPPGPYCRRDSTRGGNRGTTRLSGNAWGSRSNPGSGQKLSPGPGPRNSFGSRRCDYGSPFGQSEPRPASQRRSDPYSELGPPSNVVQLGRFSRGVRVANLSQPAQGHWQDNRGKTQNQRYY